MAKKLKDTDYLFISTYLHSREGGRLHRHFGQQLGVLVVRQGQQLLLGLLERLVQTGLGSINILAKKPDDWSKGLILCGIVEFYAILSLLASMLCRTMTLPDLLGSSHRRPVPASPAMPVPADVAAAVIPPNRKGIAL